MVQVRDLDLQVFSGKVRDEMRMVRFSQTEHGQEVRGLRKTHGDFPLSRGGQKKFPGQKLRS